MISENGDNFYTITRLIVELKYGSLSDLSNVLISDTMGKYSKLEHFYVDKVGGKPRLVLC